jgi:putative endonuclease
LQIASKKAFGGQAEDFVANHLKQSGYIILEQNYRQRFGEIDLIVKKKDTLIFIEVKARNTHYFNLSQLISYSKQQKIIKTARHYCAQKEIIDMVIRFDVALLEYADKSWQLTYIENAFV